MRLSLVCPLAGFLVGCSDTSTQLNTADFGGAWRYVETLEDIPNGIVCADTGTYQWTQTGAAFSGFYVQRGICRTPGGFVDNTDSGAVTEGRVVGRTVRFKAAIVCEYDGRLDPETGRITGLGVCALNGTQDTPRLSGAWSATR